MRLSQENLDILQREVRQIRTIALQASSASQTVAIRSVKQFASQQAAMTALAGTGEVLWYPAGTYPTSVPLVVPSNLRIWLDEGAIISGSLGITGSKLNSILQAGNVNTLKTTLASTPSFGSKTFVVTSSAALAIGQTITLTSVTYNQLTYTYVIENLVGTTVTVDRPLLMPWDGGDSVSLITGDPTNVVIEGKGTVTGVADTMVYILGGQYCEVNGITIAPTGASSYGLYFDVGGYRNRARDVRVEANGNGSTSTVYASAFFVQCNQSTVLEDCAAKNFAPAGTESAGITFMDCAECETRGSEAEGCGIGILFIANNDTAPGCYACKGIGGATVSNIAAGFDIAYGTSYCTVIGVDISWNGGSGVLNETGSYANSVIGCKIRGNINGVVSTGDKFSVIGCEVDGNSGYGFETVGGSIEIVGCTCEQGNVSGWGIFETPTTLVNIIGGNFELGTGTGVYVDATRVNVKGARFNAGSIVLDVAVTGSVLSCDDVMLSGTPTIGLSVVTGATARIGPNVHLTSATTPVSGSGFINRKGAVVANGTTPVAVAFPDITTYDVVLFTVETPVGTPGHPTYTITAGTGFTLVSQAADASTYEWFIP